MTSLTRWILSHKRLVVAFWIATTVAGVAAAGPATRALKLENSTPNKEGSLTNAGITKRYGNGGEAYPLLPVATLPAGMTIFGRAWDEATLIKLAYAYEQATHQRHPPPAIK